MLLGKDSSHVLALSRPQLHSRKCHHTYNATRELPRAIWIRSWRFGLGGDCALVYEILLYYDHNRACTIYRSPEDFRRLKAGVGRLSPLKHPVVVPVAPAAAADDECVVEDVEDLQRYLVEAVKKKGRSGALEYFLRRRMDDCAGM